MLLQLSLSNKAATQDSFLKYFIQSWSIKIIWIVGSEDSHEEQPPQTAVSTTKNHSDVQTVITASTDF